jgi:hypothetical protein
MPVLKMKLDGEKYEVDPDTITLSEARVLKCDYGMTDFKVFNYFDPDQMVGLFAIAIKRAHPEMPDEEIRSKVEGIETGPIFEELHEQLEAALRDAVDPPTAGAESSAPAKAKGKSGSTARTRKKGGTRD